jgi:hypothetical protein
MRERMRVSDPLRPSDHAAVRVPSPPEAKFDPNRGAVERQRLRSCPLVLCLLMERGGIPERVSNDLMSSPLHSSEWHRLSPRGDPVSVCPMPSDRGRYASLWHVRWADRTTAVLKIGNDIDRSGREHRFYSDVAPSHEHPSMVGSLKGSERIVLLLEDLTALRSGDILVGATPDEALHAVTALGGIHARHWGRGPMGWPAAAPRWRGTTIEVVHAFLERYPHDWALQTLTRLPTAVESQRAVLSSAPLTLVHADAHLDNWMFDSNRAVLIDWETARMAPGVIDLVRFLMEGVTTETRRASQDELITHWRRTTGCADLDTRRWLRAAVWWTLDAMLPHHATVDLTALPPRMRVVHQQVVAQALNAASDLIG